MDECDKCLSKIENGKCDCGEWFDMDDPAVSDRLVYFDALTAFKKSLDEGKVRPVMGSDLAGEDIQMLLFKGSSDDFDYIKKQLRERLSLCDDCDKRIEKDEFRVTAYTLDGRVCLHEKKPIGRFFYGLKP